MLAGTLDAGAEWMLARVGQAVNGGAGRMRLWSAGQLENVNVTLVAKLFITIKPK